MRQSQQAKAMAQSNFGDLNLSLASIPENINLVEPYVAKVKLRYSISDDVSFNILIVLTEAVNNGIIHGNCANPDKSVYVRLLPQTNQNSLGFEISDEGCGFDPKKVPDPTSPNYINQPNGRGVFLMRKLSSNIQYANNGRSVQIFFAI